VLAVALVGVGAGCETTTDDEMVPRPRKTVTRTPTPSPSPAPASVPVGDGEVSPDDVVWAQGTVLHVGRRSVDLITVTVDAFVVVPGGVYVLSSGELWFTDLSRLRGTNLTDLTRLGATPDRSRVLLTGTQGRDSREYAYDTGSGQSVSSEGLEPATAAELLGEAGGVEVRRPRWTGAVPDEFRPVGRAGRAQVYGLALEDGEPKAVLSCRETTRVCIRLGKLAGPDPVVFGSGS
jgi:hypothetical protein